MFLPLANINFAISNLEHYFLSCLSKIFGAGGAQKAIYKAMIVQILCPKVGFLAEYLFTRFPHTSLIHYQSHQHCDSNKSYLQSLSSEFVFLAYPTAFLIEVDSDKGAFQLCPSFALWIVGRLIPCTNHSMKAIWTPSASQPAHFSDAYTLQLYTSFCYFFIFFFPHLQSPRDPRFPINVMLTVCLIFSFQIRIKQIQTWCVARS